MTWIKTISFEQAQGKLLNLYKRVAGPNGQIDNILKAHSLRPHTLQGHMVLYKNVLHHVDNQLDKWYLETIGVYVSMLNRCQYCVDHHSAGLKKIVGPHRHEAILNILTSENLAGDGLSSKQWIALQYAKALTQLDHDSIESSMNKVRERGYSDGEILEINQVVSYFNYANRTVLGLGVDTSGETLGLAPKSTSSENWSHE